MRIQSDSTTLHNKPAQVNFGRTIVADIGASNPRGSLKMDIYSASGKKEKTVGSTVLCTEPIASSDHFISQLGNRIQESVSDLPQNDLIDKVVVFIPGQSKDNLVAVMTNIKDKEGKPLANIDFNSLWNKIPSAKDKTLQMSVANDMFGAGSGMVQLLLDNPKYRTLLEKDGFSGTIAMTGGGLGVIGMRRIGDKVQLEGSESGHIHYKKGKPLEIAAASGPALVRNYAKALGLSNENREKLLKTGNARMATEYEIRVDKTGNEYKSLINTGLFDEKDCPTCPHHADLTLKGISADKHSKAALKAVDKYLNAVAQLAQIKMTEGNNAFFLIGPIAGAVQRFLVASKQDSTNYFKVSSDTPAENYMKTILKSKVHSTSDAGALSMAQMSGFEIITDIHVPNNTIGGLLFADSQTVKDVPYLFRIPLPALKA